MISRMKLLEVGEDGLAAYEIEMVPWLWFLHQFHDCRIFQNKSVPDIIEQVFKDRGFTDFEMNTCRARTSRGNIACSTARPISTSSPG